MVPSLYALVRTKTSKQKACLQEQSRIGIFIWNTEAGFPRGSARNAAIQNWKQKIQRTWNKRKTILNLAANRKNKAIIKVYFWKIKTERNQIIYDLFLQFMRRNLESKRSPKRNPKSNLDWRHIPSWVLRYDESRVYQPTRTLQSLESRTRLRVIKRKATRHENYHEQKRPAAYRTCEKHLGIICKSKEVRQ